MRVLWFSTNAANYKSSNTKAIGYNGGGWMSSLQSELIKHDNIELGLCFCVNGEPAKSMQEGTTYYTIPHHKKSKCNKLLDILNINNELRDEILWPYYIEQAKRVINDFKPDVIEVFGSELYIGLSVFASRELNVPCVLHIQGILNPIFKALLPIGASKWSFYKKDGISGIYKNWQYYAYWKRSCHREKSILNAVQHVIGRTDWDEQISRILSPNAKYHYGGEILRPCFYFLEDRNFPTKPVIITTSSNATYKGIDVVLKIANILKYEYGLDFEWKVFGNVDPGFFEELTGLKHEDLNIVMCGVATADELRAAMLNASLYLQPSYIENSPNSVAEAQILGLPVVATNVGGTESLIDDGKTGLLFPCTDPYIGASRIITLLNNQAKANTLGSLACKEALRRHDKELIVQKLIETYKEIINIHNNS